MLWIGGIEGREDKSMRLLECYIENFGGLSGYIVSFDKGLTVIMEPNGFGKTTLAAFIKAMFYGFPKGARSTEKNERKLYTPWQGGKFGGNLSFEHEGKKYRIERSFGSTPKQDTFALYELEPLRRSERFSEKIGLELFKLDVESYEKSTYMAQQWDNSVFATTGIQTKLGDLFEETDDIYNFDKAVALLKEKRSSYKAYRGNNGSLYELRNKLSLLQKKISQKPAVEADCLELKNKYDEIILQEKRIKNQLEAERKRIVSATEAAASKSLNRQYQELLKEKAQINDALEDLLSDYKRGCPSKESVDEALNALENINSSKKNGDKRGLHKILFALALAGLVAVAVLFYFRLFMPMGIACGAAVICFIAGVIIAGRKGKQEETGVEYIVLENFAKKYGLAEIPTTYGQLRKINEDVIKGEALFNSLEKVENKIDGLIAESGHLLSEDKPSEAMDLHELKASEKRLEKELEQLEAERLRLSNRLNEKKKELSVYPELEDEMEEVLNRIGEEKVSCEIVEETISMLQQAKDNITDSQINPVKERVEYYIDLLLKEEEFEFFMDNNLNVKPECFGEARDLISFSAGYKDIVRLCMHFALVDVLFGKTEGFIILDDPFVNLDDEKTRAALSLLNQMSNYRQLIYMVCNSSRV